MARALVARRRGAYFDLEQPEDRLRLDVEWEALVESNRLVVLDEAQSHPPIFPRLRGAIDGRRSINGRFLLLGSVAPALMTQVSESLAGRLALVELGPLALNEVTSAARRDRLWLTGGFPDGGILTPRDFPRWQRDYLALLAQRDLPQWGLPATPQTTDRFFRMLASVHGQLWNASQFGQSLGLSYHTVNGYLDRLAGAFLVRRLTSFHANIGKRLIKAPKVYWRDSGLLHALLGVRGDDDLWTAPWVGASWEGFVIEQALAAFAQRGEAPTPHFFRTSDGREIDLVLEVGRERWAIEIKLTTSPSDADLARLDELADLIDADRRVLVTRSRRIVESGRHVAADLEWLVDALSAGTRRSPDRR